MRAALLLWVALLASGCTSEAGADWEYLFTGEGGPPMFDDDDGWWSDLPDQDEDFGLSEHSSIPSSVSGGAAWFTAWDEGVCVLEGPGGGNTRITCFGPMGNITLDEELSFGMFLATLDDTPIAYTGGEIENVWTGEVHAVDWLRGFGGGEDALWGVTDQWRLQEIDDDGVIQDNRPLPSVVDDNIDINFNEGVAVAALADSFWLTIYDDDEDRRYILKLGTDLEPRGIWGLTDADPLGLSVTSGGDLLISVGDGAAIYRVTGI